MVAPELLTNADAASLWCSESDGLGKPGADSPRSICGSSVASGWQCGGDATAVAKQLTAPGGFCDKNDTAGMLRSEATI
jgi:hypothetical protein